GDEAPQQLTVGQPAAGVLKVSEKLLQTGRHARTLALHPVVGQGRPARPRLRGIFAILLAEGPQRVADRVKTAGRPAPSRVIPDLLGTGEKEQHDRRTTTFVCSIPGGLLAEVKAQVDGCSKPTRV